MATHDVPATDQERTTVAITQLVTAADGDTVFRDVYLRRAAALLSPIVDAQRHRGWLVRRDQLGRLLAQARAAVGREDWAEVQDLSTRAGNLQKAIDAESAVMAIAETVYAAPTVAIDPLSPGLAGSKRWSDPATALAEVRETLTKLSIDDPEKRTFYAARHEALARVAVSTSPTAAEAPTATSDTSPHQRAMLALERGDASALASLAASMLGRTSQSATTASETAPIGSIRAPEILGEPIPAECLPRAERLGLVPAEAVADGELAAEIADFVARHALGASPAAYDRARDGVARVSMTAEQLDVPRELAKTFADTVSLFALHLYVNSAGVRYVPVPAKREHVLVEGHADGDDAVGPLLDALGLDRRLALSRDEIEERLQEHGAAIVDERLGLDPLAFRLVCIPPDLFMRLGRSRGWGGREQWTHFDGYQVLRGGRLRALVGGNARFGGLADLCSISRDDARDNTVVRFAVVRRERLGVRIG